MQLKLDNVCKGYTKTGTNIMLPDVTHRHTLYITNNYCKILVTMHNSEVRTMIGNLLRPREDILRKTILNKETNSNIQQILFLKVVIMMGTTHAD